MGKPKPEKKSTMTSRGFEAVIGGILGSLIGNDHLTVSECRSALGRMWSCDSLWDNLEAQRQLISSAMKVKL